MNALAEKKLIQENLDLAMEAAKTLGIEEMDASSIFWGQYIPSIKFKGPAKQMQAIHNQIVSKIGEHISSEIRADGHIIFYWKEDYVSVGVAVPMPIPNPEDINPYAS